MKKKAISALALAAVLSLSISPLVFAADITPQSPPTPQFTIDTIIDILNRMVNWFFAVVLILAAIFLIFAAIRFFTAAGDEEALATAKSAVVWALVGIAIALLAKGLIYLVAQIVGVEAGVSL